MVGSDGAVQVSKPAMARPGAAWVGAGGGLLASAGPVGFGVGFGVGLGLDPVGGEPGGVSQDAPGPVGATALGQAGFLAATRPAACTTTGCRLMWIESPARSGPACVVAARVVAAWVVAAWRTVASICSAAPGPVTKGAPIDGALSGM